MKRWLFVLLAIVLVVGVWNFSPRARMIVGGVFVNLAYWSQDHVTSFDLQHDHPSPDDIMNFFLKQNEMASQVRKRFPRTPRHPEMAIVMCMDRRLDPVEVVADTRMFYYVIRNAGATIGPKEQENLEVAVRQGAGVVLFTRHSDCAGETLASDSKVAPLFPETVHAIEERDMRLRQFLARPYIQERVKTGRLLVKIMDIDTMNEHAFPHRDHPSILTEPETPGPPPATSH